MVSDSRGNAKLTIRDVTKRDEGMYSILCFNKGGRTKMSCDLRVIDKSKSPSADDKLTPDRDMKSPGRRSPVKKTAPILDGTLPIFLRELPERIDLKEGDPLHLIVAVSGDPRPIGTFLFSFHLSCLP